MRIKGSNSMDDANPPKRAFKFVRNYLNPTLDSHFLLKIRNFCKKMDYDLFEYGE
jgi:hypothetical protein